ncbi:MAG: tRNA (guanosine(37)-N1)-methyltransferase TrmD [Candidatus Neomarinimicrobiota bacterium]
MKHAWIITPVPGIIESVIENTILRQAKERDIVSFHIVNLRDFSEGNYRQIDDAPFGGGSGMVMMAEPIFKAIDHINAQVDKPSETRVIYPTPQGKKWTQKTAVENAKVENLIFINGHYKGIDERVVQSAITHEYSIGDYILSCGELPAMIMIDSIVRIMPGVLNNFESAATDSFSEQLLDAPYYTRPRKVRDIEVPEVLLSGNHKDILKWRKDHREKRTKDRRPDLWQKYIKNLETTEK